MATFRNERLIMNSKKNSMLFWVAVGTMALLFGPMGDARAQVNSGSNGSDGALNPTSSLVIDMHDHPTGIYQYTSVNIPAGVTVTFVPNDNNTPVVWLVQSNCVINGTVDVSGKAAYVDNVQAQNKGGLGGPGGGAGGNGGPVATVGQGPGGGRVTNICNVAGNASYATQAGGPVAGTAYGNRYLLPLLGGSGGGGNCFWSLAGGGGGGAILIAASAIIEVNGIVQALGGNGSAAFFSDCIAYGGYGSGGGIRLVTTSFRGNGAITAVGANGIGSGDGWVRVDAYVNTFTGTPSGSYSTGFQPIILPGSGQNIRLTIVSVASTPIGTNPTGQLATPDVIIPGQVNNPIPIVVQCANLPLNSSVTVIVQPPNGPAVQATGLNSSGTLASSTATISVNMPRGGGIIYAQAVLGVQTASLKNGEDAASYAQTGLNAFGERFSKVEITAGLGGQQTTTYITASGKRYSLAAK